MKRALRSHLGAALVAAFTLAPLAAQAQLFADDEARRAILQLRERVNNMQNEINAKMDKTGTLDLHNQNEALRQEIARLRGQIEVLTNELANTQKRQKDFYVDLDARLRKLEPQKVVVDGREITVEQAEQRAYDAALTYFREGEYRNAAASLYDFTRRYPQSGLVPSAQYWLGNTYYAMRDYQNAIAAHQVVLDRFPTDSRAPEALLNIASCHLELKNRDAARTALETLLSRYPDSPAAATARERLQNLR
ncbi:MAG TPA: tol-pal system protein YbgF [Noviherbaspirillum sp.]|nr:tol-pal system protein YbgF [Noviherbaspirillum sp.]